MRTIVGLGSPVSLCSCPTVLHGRRLSASSSSKARVTAWLFVGAGGFTEDRSKGLRIDPSLWYRWSRRPPAAWAIGRASCCEGVRQSVCIAVVVVYFTIKKTDYTVIHHFYVGVD